MRSLDDYFSIQVFLIVLRETLESAIIISVLLAFVIQNFSNSTKKHTFKASTNSEYDSTAEQQQGLLHNSEGRSESEVDVTTKKEIEEREKEEVEIKKYLKMQIWAGGFLGLACCMVIGAIILWIFYMLGSDVWSVAEHYWEGGFSIIASIIISIMGVKILRVNKMKEKWSAKLHAAIKDSKFNKLTYSQTKKDEKMWSDRYFMFILPFVTTLREGMEAIVFIGGIGINEDTSVSSILNAVIAALFLGSLIGFLLYRSGNSLSLQWFLISSTCLLYLVAAGLFSKGVWNFELQSFINACGGLDVSETGHGPGSYDIKRSVWHVNCCNGELHEDGAFWMIFTAILGWTNSATYGSVLAYIGYWVVIIYMFWCLIYEEQNGLLPIPVSWQRNRIRKRLALQKKYAQLTEEEPRNSLSSTSPLQS